YTATLPPHGGCVRQDRVACGALRRGIRDDGARGIRAPHDGPRTPTRERTRLAPQPKLGDEAPEAEPFQEPRDSPTGHAGGNDYRAPLILQEQVYANHGSQEVQVTAANSCPAPTVSYPSGGGRRGLQERGRDPTSPPQRSEQGVLR
ncbi:hypothetical protein PSTG_18730, partial [Puccinia striiformis f. sp. tritici PST-78]